MNNPILQCKNGNIYFLDGKLNFETVPLLWRQSQDIFKDNRQPLIIFDFSGVTQSDSSGVALLIAWMRNFRRASRIIEFIHLPEQMLAIVRLAGLSTIMPIIYTTRS